MPINRLLVEGSPEDRILLQVFAGSPVVQATGTKGDLPHIVRRELRLGKIGIAYLRDRDFDFEPDPTPTDKPQIDQKTDELVHGYRWERTEIENYLLEPATVAAAINTTEREFVAALQQAAESLLAYTAGRWTLGQLRKRTRRVMKMNTRPDELLGRAFPLPKSLAENDVRAWIIETVDSIRRDVNVKFDTDLVHEQFIDYKSKLQTKTGLAILYWYSGKDLFGVLEPYFLSKGFNNPSDARERIVSWIENPTNRSAMLRAFPEWQNLITILNG